MGHTHSTGLGNKWIRRARRLRSHKNRKEQREGGRKGNEVKTDKEQKSSNKMRKILFLVYRRVLTFLRFGVRAYKWN
jgi:hypothetical protein